MRELPTIRGYRVGAGPSFSPRYYVYGGNQPLNKDAEVAGNVQPCGTPAAARRHYLRGEKPCRLCRDAERSRTNKAGLKRRQTNESFQKSFTPEKCGTNSGHQRHIYYGNTPCEECKVAHRAYQRKQRADLKARKTSAGINS
ncbi:transcriptional regulator WhiB-like [Arthrobacter phage vB_ArS-ArV2]|uniref:Transcriptional factor WhiB-like protein n=1 Tax=Arthrobacter phage vB_ArS-ArV2 TaxID=1414742 RepID=V5RBE5_9CAUD|nr:transcriptional regulator WhiB-like [Arthrobacter phage vB_ArS-ArV2]AHB31649.1 transcriptional factor WhiB-like protein [Arthrobacter phage vB_ArS-ArV2]